MESVFSILEKKIAAPDSDWFLWPRSSTQQCCPTVVSELGEGRREQRPWARRRGRWSGSSPRCSGSDKLARRSRRVSLSSPLSFPLVIVSPLFLSSPMRFYLLLHRLCVAGSRIEGSDLYSPGQWWHMSYVTLGVLSLLIPRTSDVMMEVDLGGIKCLFEMGYRFFFS